MLHDCDPGLGPGAPRFTSCPASCTGSELRIRSLKSEKIAVFAPIPKARETMATLLTKGLFQRLRRPSLMFDKTDDLRLRRWGERWGQAQTVFLTLYRLQDRNGNSLRTS